MSEPNPPQPASGPTWVTLLAIKVGQDANAWLNERRFTYRRTLRELAEEVTELIGHSVSHETIRRHMLAVDAKAAS